MTNADTKTGCGPFPWHWLGRESHLPPFHLLRLTLRVPWQSTPKHPSNTKQLPPAHSASVSGLGWLVPALQHLCQCHPQRWEGLKVTASAAVTQLLFGSMPGNHREPLIPAFAIPAARFAPRRARQEGPCCYLAAVVPRDLSDTFLVQRMLFLFHKHLQEDTKPAALSPSCSQHLHPHPGTSQLVGYTQTLKSKPLGTAAPQPDAFSLACQASSQPGGAG